MTTLSKLKLQDQVLKIALMDINALSSFACNLSMSEIDDKSRTFLNRAVDLRYSQLIGIDTDGLVVCGEIKADDVGL